MRKIFLFLFAAVLSIGTASAYDVEINDANWTVVAGYELSLDQDGLYLHSFNFDDYAIDQGVNYGVSEDDGGQTTIFLQLTSSELEADEEWVEAQVISYSPLAASATLAISGTTESGKTFSVSGTVVEEEYRETLDIEMKDLQITEDLTYKKFVASGSSMYAGTITATLLVAEDGTLLGGSSINIGGEDVDVIEGSVAKNDEYSEYYGTDVYVGVATVEYYGTIYDFNLVMYYIAIDYTMIEILGASAVEVDIDCGWGEIYTTLKIESTYTDGSETYPVSIEMDKPTEASGTTYATVTIGGWGDDDPWLGFVDGAELEYEVEDGWLTLTGKVVNEWTEPKIYWDLNITAKLPVILGEGDNSAILGTTANYLQVKREFVAGNLYTLSLPFAINNVASVFGNGTKVYEYANLKADDQVAEGVVLGFKEVTSIAAGKPYLIEPSETLENGFTVNNVTLSATTTTLSYTVNKTTIAMVPVLSALDSNSGKYWLAENTWLYNDNVAVPALRALFTISTTNGIAPRARVALGENETTGVDNITTGAKAVKAIENGQLIITIDGVKYNVQGVRL